MARQVLYRQRIAIVRLDSARGGGACIQGSLRIFEDKPPPLSGPCLLLKRGGGAYFREDTVL